MLNQNPTPLDYDEVISQKKVAFSPTQRKLQLLEWIPLLMLGAGLWLSLKGYYYGDSILKIGAISSALLYLFFSWYMFRVEKYHPLELLLSILCGLIFPVGLLGILSKKELWAYSEKLTASGIYGGLALLLVSIILFAFHLKDKRASLFYRNLISRLLIFTILLLYLNNG